MIWLTVNKLHFCRLGFMDFLALITALVWYHLQRAKNTTLMSNRQQSNLDISVTSRTKNVVQFTCGMLLKHVKTVV